MNQRAARMQFVAATGLPPGRVRITLVDEVNPWPAESSADAIILDHARRAVRLWEASMLLREKGKKDAEPLGFGWDEAQALLSAGTHEVFLTDDGEAKASGTADSSASEELKKPDTAPKARTDK